MVLLAFATVYLVWGSTYFFIQVAVQHMAPMILGAFRFLAAGVLMLIYCLVRGEGFGDRRLVGRATLTGILMLGFGTGGVIWAEKWLPSSLVAILISTAPFWFVLLDAPHWRKNLTSRSVLLGLLFGFIGVLFMFGEKLFDAFRLNGNPHELLGLGILMFGTMSWAGGSLYSKYRGSGSANLNSAWQMLIAGVVFLAGSVILGDWKTFSWSAVPSSAWWSVIYLIVFGSLAAYSAYVWLLRVRPVAQVSTYAYVNPVVAVLLGISFGGETLTIYQVAGLVIIIVCVMAINRLKLKVEN
jgi:drug/metabolite transporter (DMT)-like permease